MYYFWMIHSNAILLYILFIWELFKNTNSILELYIILINLYYNDVIYISLVSKFIEISIGVIAMLVGIALIGGLI